MRVPLLALLAALSAPPCQRWNPELCDDIRPCGGGRICGPPEADGRRRCVPADGGWSACTSSAECPEELPLCGAGLALCRACQPGEDAACRERNPRLPRCLGPRCVECLPGADSIQSGDCPPGAPVCDRGSASCRPCRLHAECRSGVCVKDDRTAPPGLSRGMCVPEDQVLVIDQTACNDLGPVFCTPAVALSRMDRGHRHLVFRRTARNMEVLLSELDVGLNEPQRGIDLHLIGPLSDGPPDQLQEMPPVTIGGIRARRGFIVWPRTRVTIEGFFIAGAQIGLDCIGDQAVPTEVRLVRSLLGDNRTAVSLKNGCRLELRESWLGRRPPQGRFRGIHGNRLALEVLSSDFDIENSVLCGNGAADSFGGIRIVGLGGRPLSTVVNTTFFAQAGRAAAGGRFYTDLVCEGTQDRLAVLNSLFLHGPDDPLPADGYVSPACGPHLYALGSDDPQLGAQPTVLLPPGQGAGFRDVAALDLRLAGEGEGPAQQALRSGGLPAVTVRGVPVAAPPADMDGRPRPSGRLAIGAYEPVQ